MFMGFHLGIYLTYNLGGVRTTHARHDFAIQLWIIKVSTYAKSVLATLIC